MSKLDDIFSNITARVTSDAPTQNYLVKIEDGDSIKQEVKELFSALGDEVISNPKEAAKWRRKVADL